MKLMRWLDQMKMHMGSVSLAVSRTIQKGFYGYTRKLQTVKDVVAALKKEDGELTAKDQEAADELANCFQKIFLQNRTVMESIKWKRI